MLESLLTHLNESARTDVLRSLFTCRNFEAFLTEQASFLSSQPARLVADFSRMRLEANKKFEEFSRLRKHAVRSTAAAVRSYIEALGRLEEHFRNIPNLGSWKVVQRHSEHAAALLDELQSGAFADSIAGVMYETLQEDLAKDAEALIKQIAKAGNGAEADDVDDEDVKMHDKFVKSLEKDFDIAVHHFEPVNDGVFVFVDEENNDKLLAGLKSMEARLNDLTQKHGYILLRKGTTDDIVWGSYPNGMAKWMFIYSPPDSDKWADSMKDMEDEVLSHAKEMTNKEPKKSVKPSPDLKKVKEDWNPEHRLTSGGCTAKNASQNLLGKPSHVFKKGKCVKCGKSQTK